MAKELTQLGKEHHPFNPPRGSFACYLFACLFRVPETFLFGKWSPCPHPMVFSARQTGGAAREPRKNTSWGLWPRLGRAASPGWWCPFSHSPRSPTPRPRPSWHLLWLQPGRQASHSFWKLCLWEGRAPRPAVGGPPQPRDKTWPFQKLRDECRRGPQAGSGSWGSPSCPSPHRSVFCHLPQPLGALSPRAAVPARSLVMDFVAE